MTLLTNNLDGYHSRLIKDLAKHDSNSEGNVSICSGDQRITMQAVLLRNMSKLLKEILPTPCSCSCTDNCIILPHTQSPALNIFISLLHGKVIPSVSNDVTEAVNTIATSLGVMNIVKTENEGVEDADGEETFKKMNQNINNNDINSTFQVKNVIKFADQLVNLQFPKSRLEREKKPNPSKYFQPNTFKGRVQEEYNLHQIGQYMGPYDQSKEISLSAQLPLSNLNFQTYTEFSHDGNQCFKYNIENYEGFDDLNKISSYTISAVIGCDDEKAEDDDIDIFYTCQHNLSVHAMLL